MPNYRNRDASDSTSQEKKKFPRWAKIGLIILGVILLLVVLFMVFKPVASAAAAASNFANAPPIAMLPSLSGGSSGAVKTGSSGILGGILTTGPAPGGVFNPVNILPNAVGSIKSLFGK